MIILSVCLIIVGWVIRVKAIKTLKSDWSNVIVRPSRICQEGLYKYIRHPSYLGSILILIGLFLLKDILGFLYLCFIFYYSRIALEERMMISKDYKDYKKKVGMLFPRIRRNK